MYDERRVQDTVLGGAYRALGDEVAALSEFGTARDTFARQTPGGLTEREVEVLMLVAGSGRG